MTSELAALAFRERPARELLALDRDHPDPEFEGYGWARVDRLWLAGDHGWPRRLDQVLVIAAHAADDGIAQADDIELDFAVPGGLLRVQATAFLRAWLPRLPPSRTIVLAMCNPHGATLRPVSATAALHYGTGDVRAWLDPGDRMRLTAGAWRTLDAVTNELTPRAAPAITEDQAQTYVGLYLLKKLDLRPEDGGLAFPVVLPSDLAPLDEPLQQLAVDDKLAINRKSGQWQLTRTGIAYLGEHIDEAAALVDELDELEVEAAIAELRARNLDVFRARFLWGWYDGEFYDLVVYQQRRGVSPVERLWAYYLTSGDLWRELARDLEP